MTQSRHHRYRSVEPGTKKILKISAWSLLVAGALVLITGSVITSYVLSSITDFAFYTPESKPLLQRVTDEERDRDYLLLTNGRRKEPTWYVYVVPQGDAPTQEMIAQGSSAPQLFRNYSESGYQAADPLLELVDRRFLVFSRGGVRHALYDLDEDQELVNYSYWDSARANFRKQLGRRPTRAEVLAWKMEEYDFRIMEIIGRFREAGENHADVHDISDGLE